MQSRGYPAILAWSASFIIPRRMEVTDLSWHHECPNSILSSSTEVLHVGLSRHAAQASFHGRWWNQSFRPVRLCVTDRRQSPCLQSHQNGAPDQASTERSGRIAPHGSIHPLG